MTFTVGGSTVTSAKKDDVVTIAGKEIARYYYVGATSEQVTITDNTFTMPAEAVTVTAEYYKLADCHVTVSKAGHDTAATAYDLESNTAYVNLSYTYDGGAVNISQNAYAKGTNLLFRGNTAGTSSSGKNGGAIYNNRGTLTISGDATFIDNTANGSNGGAILNSGTLTIGGNATFTGNKATTNTGGAINNAAAMTIGGDATFTGNSAKNAGGAINNTSGLTINGNATFTGNSAQKNGGAINNGGTLTLNGDVMFSGNSTAADGGGAIYNSKKINFAGEITLATESDTWENLSTNPKSTKPATIINWDLTRGTEQYGSITNFQRYKILPYTKTNVYYFKQTITVAAQQETGTYILATGDMTDWAADVTGKYQFTVLKSGSSTESGTLTVGNTVKFNDLFYTLSISDNGTPETATDDKLVLTVISTVTDFAVSSNWATAAPCTEVTLDGETYITGISAYADAAALVNGGFLTETSNIVFEGGNTQAAAYNPGTVTFAQSVHISTVNGQANFDGENNLVFNADGQANESTITGDLKVYRMAVSAANQGTSEVTVTTGTAITMDHVEEGGVKTAGLDSTIQVQNGGSLIVEENAQIDLAGRLYNHGNMTVYGEFNISDYAAGEGPLSLAANADGSESATLTVDGGVVSYDSTLETSTDDAVVMIGNDDAISSAVVNITNGGELNISGNASLFIYDGATLNLTNSSSVTVDGTDGTAEDKGDLNSSGTINMDYTSRITATGSFINNSKLVVNMAGAAANKYLLIDGGAGSTFEDADCIIENGEEYVFYTDEAKGDLYVARNVYFVNSDWTAGQQVTVVYDGLTYKGEVNGSDSKFYNDESTVGEETQTKVYVGARSLAGAGGIRTESFANQVSLGYRTADEATYEGGITTTIASGVYSKSNNGGDTMTGANKLERNAEDDGIALTINGGEFCQRVAGGMFFNPATGTPTTGTTTLYGDITLTINGGIFHDRVFCGNNAKNAALGENTLVDGSIFTTINTAENTITFAENIVAGNRGSGVVTGDTSLTFTGLGSKLVFNEDSVVWGGCSGDAVFQNDETLVRRVSTSVEGDRKIAFNNFTGDFGARVQLFNTADFTGNTDVNFTDAELDMWGIKNWNFAYGSSASGITDWDLTGDNLTLDLTGFESDSWEILSGSSITADGSLKVYFGADEAQYNEQSKCWTYGDCTLAITDDKEKETSSMILTKAI